MKSDGGPERKFWQLPIAALQRELGSGRDGLSSVEAQARQIRYGPNTLEERRRLSLSLEFLSRFRNPLVIILLVAAAISALTGDLASFIIISTIVLMSAVLDTVQEYRAEEAAEHLKVSVALKEQVLRDGQRGYGAGPGPCPRRCRAARRRGSGPGGWAPPRGQGFFRQRGIADGRVLPGGEARARSKASTARKSPRQPTLPLWAAR